ncbi:MAG: hypothetical protein Kow00121_65420 [Elainellaceae cyanobacterium]
MSTASAPTQQLIPAVERVKFVTLYVSLTFILWVLGGILFSLPPLSLIPNLAIRISLSALITGLSAGVGQWFALYPYISSWLWILATAIGAAFAAVTQHLGYTALLDTLNHPESNQYLAVFTESPLAVLIPLQGITLLGFCLWFAGAQWLVLRRYAKAAAWWLLTPAIATLLVWLILLLQFLLWFLLRQQFLSDRVLLPGMIAAVQALMLCRFQRRDPVVLNESETHLETAAELPDPVLLDIEPIDMQSTRLERFPFAGLAIATVLGVVLVSMSMQGFLLWFGI